MYIYIPFVHKRAEIGKNLFSHLKILTQKEIHFIFYLYFEQTSPTIPYTEIKK
jgi:hypothetical protein